MPRAGSNRLAGIDTITISLSNYAKCATAVLTITACFERFSLLRVTRCAQLPTLHHADLALFRKSARELFFSGQQRELAGFLGGLISTEDLQLLNLLIDVGYRGGAQRSQAFSAYWGGAGQREKGGGRATSG